MAEEETTVAVSDEDIKKVEQEVATQDSEKEKEIADKVRKEMEQEAETKKIVAEKEALEAKLKEQETELEKAREEQKKVLDAEVERRVQDAQAQRKATITPPNLAPTKEQFDTTQVRDIEEESRVAFENRTQ